MRTNIFLAGIAIFVLPLSSPAYAGDKDQKGNGGDKVKSAQGNGGERKANNGNKGAGKTMDRIRGNGDQYVRSNGKGEKANGAKLASPVGNDFNGDRKFERKAKKAGVVNIARGDMERGDNSRMRIFENGRYAWREPSFQGCPPGLAKKNNGCLPPGQARKLAGFNDEQAQWYRYSSWFNANRSDDWRYDQGYAYRINQSTSLVQSIVPLLGGALFSGNAWPQGYTDYQVSPYYERFYGSGSNDNFRYADGAMFSVNSENQMIGSIVGLLTGDNWRVGSPAPQGYDLYNVPSDYRDQYADGQSSSYRYNDGYVYEVDPTTQIVRKIIELVL